MKIIVVGCGKIGTSIVSSLTAEGHDVVAIDKNPTVIEEITNIYDTMGVCGNGADCETLGEAGVADTELFISVADSDEMNMLACFLAKKMGASYTIARIRNPEYNDKSLGFMRTHLGIDMAVNPELLAAREFFRLLKLPSAAKVETFSGRNFEMVEIKLKEDSVLNGLSLIEMRKKYQFNVLVCIVQRGDEVFIPDGNFILRNNDRIGITAKPAEILKFFKTLGIMQKQAKDVMILGASKTAFYLAKMLLGGGSNVKIIELNPQRCTQFSQSLEGAVIINGDGAQQELLMEEGIKDTDAFVSMTGMDEENILISYFASTMGVPKIITKINRKEFIDLAEKLGAESIVTPRKIVADIIVRYARGLQNTIGSKIETLYKLMDGKAELLEFIVQPDCKIIGIPFKELDTKKGTLIAGIIRNRKAILPSGEDALQENDKVIIISSSLGFNDLADIVR
ncbi:MAG: Trk system potassium transporter TrkA [Acutalibacteraceae bacterium]|nr:Trk system potassium transporter TrkA [Acutalibacteraceae bacterium]